MELAAFVVFVLVCLYAFFVMLRFTFQLIDRAHEQLRREEESRDSGMPLTGERDG